jgi:hypothetical protein
VSQLLNEIPEVREGDVNRHVVMPDARQPQGLHREAATFMQIPPILNGHNFVVLAVEYCYWDIDAADTAVVSHDVEGEAR